jgi:hypothetical protein
MIQTLHELPQQMAVAWYAREGRSDSDKPSESHSARCVYYNLNCLTTVQTNDYRPDSYHYSGRGGII